MNHWSEIAEQLRQQVESRHQAREQGLQACRKATQLCARAIRSLHRHEFDACRDLLTQAYREISHAREQLRPFPQIYYAGFLQDAEKELVEGETLYAIVLGDALPEPDELGVDVGAYLNGVAEAASECRRYVLDLLRALWGAYAWRGRTRVVHAPIWECSSQSDINSDRPRRYFG